MTREVSVATTTAHTAQSAAQSATTLPSATSPSGAGEKPAETTTGRAAAVLTAAVQADGARDEHGAGDEHVGEDEHQRDPREGAHLLDVGEDAVTDCSAKPRLVRTSEPASIARRAGGRGAFRASR